MVILLLDLDDGRLEPLERVVECVKLVISFEGGFPFPGLFRLALEGGDLY